MGSSPQVAAAEGGTEVSMAVLAATFTTAIVFFRHVFQLGVSKCIVTPLAMGVALRSSLPNFFADDRRCRSTAPSSSARTNRASSPASRGRHLRPLRQVFQPQFPRFSFICRTGDAGHAPAGRDHCGHLHRSGSHSRRNCPLPRPRVLSPHRSRAIPINARMPSGTALGKRQSSPIRHHSQRRSPKDLDMIVSNIDVYPDLSAIYTTNASMDTAFVAASLKEDHSTSSFEYMGRVKEKLSRKCQELGTILNRRPGRFSDQPGPAGADRHSDQVAGHGYSYALAQHWRRRSRRFPM